MSCFAKENIHLTLIKKREIRILKEKLILSNESEISETLQLFAIIF